MWIVRAVCVFIAQNARWKKGVLSEDMAAILLCTALYLHWKSAYSVRYIAENASWKTSVLSEDIAAILLCTALYLHPKISHKLYLQNEWVSSMFFNLLFYLGKMRTVCVCITENARWKTGVLSKDIATILLCTALYLQPISSHALYVQYKRV